MEGAAILSVLFFVGLIAWAIAQGSQQAQRRKQALAFIASRLENGRYDEKQRTATGEIAGTTIQYRFATRGSGKHARPWTEIDAEIPPKYPLLMYVRKHAWGDSGKIAAGEMVDIKVGDAAFDETFLVEVAPADVARVLLDDRARGYLMSLAEKRVEITTERKDGATLRMGIYGWIDEPSETMAPIEAMVAIAGRLRAAYHAVEKANEEKESGSPYRPMLDDRRAREAADARFEEVAKLEKVRTKRAASQQALAIAVVVIFVFVWLVMLAATAGR